MNPSLIWFYNLKMEQYLFETKYNNHFFFFFMSPKKLKKKLNILGRIKCKSGKKKWNKIGAHNNAFI